MLVSESKDIWDLAGPLWDWNQGPSHSFSEVCFLNAQAYSTLFVHACSVMSLSFATPWTTARQTPLSMEFSRQKYWSRLSFPSPGNLSWFMDRNCVSCLLPGQVDSLLLHHMGSPHPASCACGLSRSVVSSSSADPWAVAHQAPLCSEFSRQEYWSGLPFPSPGDLPDPRIELGSLAWQVDSSPSEPPGNPLSSLVPAE